MNELYGCMDEIKELIVKTVKDSDEEFLELKQIKFLASMGCRIDWVYDELQKMNDSLKVKNDN